MTAEVMRMEEGEEQRSAARNPARRLPPLGTMVGGFRLEKVLGSGGYGTVYLARRGGLRFAVKFISLYQDGGAWARRELAVELRLQEVGALKLEGHGHWPDDTPHFLYIAREYVEGEPLDVWAQAPRTAREVAHVALALAGQLERIHRADVVHRDVKEANVVVRAADGQPVLVDYGISTYVGAPPLTEGVPGTRPYRSPEAVRFKWLGQPPLERRPPAPGDDLWAHGVLLYWLLTGTYPFEHPSNYELARRILNDAPQPPHERNPRVPRALGELCLRELEKAPEARYLDAAALREALEASLKEADAAWDLPLRDAPPEPQPLRPDEPPAVAELPTPPRPTVSAPPSSSEAEARVPPRARATSRLGLLLGGLALALAVVALVLALRPHPTSAVMPGAVTSEVVFSRQEVALVSEPPEGDEGAAPAGATTPAPVASATPDEDDMRVKTSPLASTPPRKEENNSPVSGSVTKAVGAVAAAAMLSACPGPQVRPTPAPEECPPGAWAAMRQLGIRPGDKAQADALPMELDSIPVVEGQQLVVRAGTNLRELSAGTLFTGRVLVGKERVYIRLTEARPPNKAPIPVCVEAWDVEGGGGVLKSRKGEPGTTTIFTGLDIKAVERFE